MTAKTLTAISQARQEVSNGIIFDAQVPQNEKTTRADTEVMPDLGIVHEDNPICWRFTVPNE